METITNGLDELVKKFDKSTVDATILQLDDIRKEISDAWAERSAKITLNDQG